MYLTKPYLYKPKAICCLYSVFVITNIFQVCFNIFFKIFFWPLASEKTGQNLGKTRKMRYFGPKIDNNLIQGGSFIYYFLMYWCEIHISSKIWLIKNIFSDFYDVRFTSKMTVLVNCDTFEPILDVLTPLMWFKPLKSIHKLLQIS